MTFIGAETKADVGLPVLPFVNITVASGCDHTPHLNLDPNYESCECAVSCEGRGEGEGDRGCIH